METDLYELGIVRLCGGPGDPGEGNACWMSAIHIFCTGEKNSRNDHPPAVDLYIGHICRRVNDLIASGCGVAMLNELVLPHLLEPMGTECRDTTEVALIIRRHAHRLRRVAMHDYLMASPSAISHWRKKAETDFLAHDARVSDTSNTVPSERGDHAAAMWCDMCLLIAADQPAEMVRLNRNLSELLIGDIVDMCREIKALPKSEEKRPNRIRVKAISPEHYYTNNPFVVHTAPSDELMILAKDIAFDMKKQTYGGMELAYKELLASV